MQVRRYAFFLLLPFFAISQGERVNFFASSVWAPLTPHSSMECCCRLGNVHAHASNLDQHFEPRLSRRRGNPAATQLLLPGRSSFDQNARFVSIWFEIGIFSLIFPLHSACVRAFQIINLLLRAFPLRLSRTFCMMGCCRINCRSAALLWSFCIGLHSGPNLCGCIKLLRTCMCLCRNRAHVHGALRSLAFRDSDSLASCFFRVCRLCLMIDMWSAVASLGHVGRNCIGLRHGRTCQRILLRPYTFQHGRGTHTVSWMRNVCFSLITSLP